MTTSTLVACTIESPIGALRLVADADATVLVGLYLPAQTPPVATSIAPRGVLALAAQQLGEYFVGTRTSFAIPTAPRGTAFQIRVWRALTRLRHGTTTTYGELASGLGQPTASRAVGLANGKNPISIVVPCHRVIGKTGALTGYAGGLAAKAWLLAHETKATA